MLITPAFAQGTQPGGSDFLISLLPFVLIFAIMYFLIIRPQQKRLKDHKDMVAALRRGDVIVTSGGVIAKVTKVINDDELQVEFSKDVRVKLLRHTVSEVRSKEDAVKEGS